MTFDLRRSVRRARVDSTGEVVTLTGDLEYALPGDDDGSRSPIREAIATRVLVRLRGPDGGWQAVTMVGRWSAKSGAL